MTKRTKKQPQKETVRASVSFPADDYERLEQLAAEKRVSLAWMVREAVSAYLQNAPSAVEKD